MYSLFISAHAGPLVIGASLVLLAQPAFAQAGDCLPKPGLAIARQGTQVRLDVAGEPGINYAIEATGDGGEWTRLGTNRSPSGFLSFVQPVLSEASQQWFRAVSVNTADGLGGSFIFDGQTFAGWEGDTARTFRIRECAIVGGSLVEALQENMYLCTTSRYTNFILRLEFKLAGTNGLVNSGVQFRSRRLAGSNEVSGYQADMGDGFWGGLYDQTRRDTVLAAADQTALGAVLRRNDWNSYVIQAQGRRIRFWINGYQTIDFTETDPTIPLEGIVGLQVHSGGLLEASFRRISLEVLP